LKVGMREDVFVTTHCPIPQIPGNVQAFAEAGAGARVWEDGAGDGELPVQFESNVPATVIHAMNLAICKSSRDKSLKNMHNSEARYLTQKHLKPMAHPT
jgi:hypothetical protein